MNRPLKSILLMYSLFCLIRMNANAQDITTGLVAHYEFENTSGDVIDAAGSHNGTNYGATRGVAGKVGNAFSFDGTDYVTINNHSDISNYSEFTLSAWIYPTSLASSKTIISKVTSGRDFVLSLANYKIQAHFYDGEYRVCNGTTTVQTGQWIHIAATWQNNQWSVYRNGILESTCDHSGYDPPWTASYMYLGALTVGSDKFSGTLDEVRIYNRALTSADLIALYNSTGGTSIPSLSLNDVSANENAPNAEFVLTLSQEATLPITLTITTSNGTATSGSDYESKNTEFTIPAGVSGDISYGINLIDDGITETDETFSITISNVSNATIGDGTGVCTIIDNDVAGGLTCSNTISTYPYSEGFESSPNTWENRVGDNTDWTRHSGSTTTSSTGPTAAQEGTYYNYIESSSPNYPSKTALLYGPCFDLSGQSQAEFSFYYHMYGTSMGTLKLEVSTDGAIWNTLWSLSGDQGDLWSQATVDLGSFLGSTVQLRFNGTTGSSYRSDMAVDNLSLSTACGGSSFWAQNGTNIYPTNTGNVGIGTTSPGEKLTVNGTIHSEEVIVDLSVPAPDYVFEKNYELLSISALKDFIEKNSHLPEFPPASEMETAGITLSQMNLSLLKRIEELTLYIIDQEKRIQEMEKQHNIENK